MPLLTTQWATESSKYALAGNLQSSTASSIFDDSEVDKQWALKKINAFDAWRIAPNARDILIAVLDTGIDENHPDLAGKVVSTVNFSSSSSADDVNGHGTHIAGIIGARANNRIGVAGVAYNSRLMNVKVADDAGFCNAKAVAAGIAWAVDNGAKVINISLTLAETSPALEAAVNYAWDKGAIIVAAAGNSDDSAPSFPACYAHSLAITASGNQEQLSRMAKHSDWVDLSAPGVNIYSILPDNTYGYKSGTSMAAAYVSGLACFLLGLAADSNKSGYLNDDVRTIIEKSAVRDGNDLGRIDMLRAVTLASN